MSTIYAFEEYLFRCHPRQVEVTTTTTYTHDILIAQPLIVCSERQFTFAHAFPLDLMEISRYKIEDAHETTLNGPIFLKDAYQLF